MHQPKLKSKVRFADREVGEVRHVIMDPLSLEVSHLVVGDGAGVPERQIPTEVVQRVTDDVVELRGTSAELERYPVFKRADYVTTHEVEIAHLEDNLHVQPGEVLVPLPILEKDVKRRTFFTAFLNAIGVLMALPFVYPVLRYLMKPMYAPFDNTWLSVGNVSRIKTDDVGVQFKYRKKVKEAFMPEAEIDKNVWVIKASPAILDEVYKGKDMEFHDSAGRVVWTNKASTPYVAYSGKCPHLGCGYKWRTHKVLGQVFLCPCHLSIYDAGGKVLDGPAPRPLDVLPTRVSASGAIEIIDMEFKAGTKARIRIV
ncbi:MAG TPA: ubiquinol-cytochrome c reductase iron-sulfur subunit [Nitrospirales bacterium]|nr:ubiquinol-cytochrome c reductase iron-sulfur subunit [Nitrospirales bacterium]